MSWPLSPEPRLLGKMAVSNSETERQDKLGAWCGGGGFLKYSEKEMETSKQTQEATTDSVQWVEPLQE